MSKFKVGDRVLFRGEIRTVERVNVYNNTLTGLARVSQMYKEAFCKDYWLNEVDPNALYENCAKESEIRKANSTIIKERLGVK